MVRATQATLPTFGAPIPLHRGVTTRSRYRGTRFFYAPHLTRYDNRYRGIAKAVYGSGSDFDIVRKQEVLQQLPVRRDLGTHSHQMNRPSDRWDDAILDAHDIGGVPEVRPVWAHGFNWQVRGDTDELVQASPVASLPP